MKESPIFGDDSFDLWCNQFGNSPNSWYQWESRSLFNSSDDRQFVSRNSMESLLVRGFQKSYFVQEDTI